HDLAVRGAAADEGRDRRSLRGLRRRLRRGSEALPDDGSRRAGEGKGVALQGVGAAVVLAVGLGGGPLAVGAGELAGFVGQGGGTLDRGPVGAGRFEL